MQFEIYSKSILASSGRHSTSSYHSDCFILKFCVEKESGCFLCIKIIHRSAEVFKQLTPSKEFTLLVNFSLTKLWLSWSPDLPVEEFSIYIADLLTNRDDADEATRAYKEAFVSQDAARVCYRYVNQILLRFLLF